MRNCNSIDPLVTPFVDGELTGADRDAVVEHTRVCAPCHSRIAAERAVRDLIRSRREALARDAAPAALRDKCREAAARAETRGASRLQRAAAWFRPAHAQPWRVRLAPYALAASLVVIVAGAFIYQLTD